MSLLQITSSATHVELRLNRPDCRNALSRELIAALIAPVIRAGQDDAVRSAILTGVPSAFLAENDR